jgi:hypothetical protein
MPSPGAPEMSHLKKDPPNVWALLRRALSYGGIPVGAVIVGFRD